MLESSVQSKILHLVRSRGGYIVKVITASKAGTPDLIACYKGSFIAIECKRPGKDGSRLQYHAADKIRAAGGVCLFADDPKTVKRMLDAIDLA